MNTVDLMMNCVTTPWGEAQTVRVMENGCFVVSTAGHGGIYVPNELLNMIPKEERLFAKQYSGSENWYEEDCCALSPMYHIAGMCLAYAGNTQDKVAGYWNALAVQYGWKKAVSLPFPIETVVANVKQEKNVDRDTERETARREILDRANKPITGTAGDMTGVLLGMEAHVSDDVPLFGWNTQRKEVAI